VGSPPRLFAGPTSDGFLVGPLPKNPAADMPPIFFVLCNPSFSPSPSPLFVPCYFIHWSLTAGSPTVSLGMNFVSPPSSPRHNNVIWTLCCALFCFFPHQTCHFFPGPKAGGLSEFRHHDPLGPRVDSVPSLIFPFCGFSGFFRPYFRRVTMCGFSVLPPVCLFVFPFFPPTLPS